MRLRHRVPTIFNLSMVDVLCCALGCVILLWLLNQRTANDRADAVEQTGQQLTQSQLSLDSAARELTGLRQALLVSRQQERQLGDRVQQQRSQADQLELATRTARHEATASLLALQQARSQAALLTDTIQTLRNQQAALSVRLANDQAAAKQAQRALDKDLQASARLLTVANARADALAVQLQTAQGRLAALGQQADQKLLAVDKKLADVLSDKYLLEQTLTLRNDELAASKSQLADVQKQVRLLKAADDGRFAGMKLTGKRVVFLLDMSGSMGKTDYHQSDPKKWPAVCATLGKVMASLPDLEKFQVILFSDDKSYPLGKEGKWLDFDPRLSDKVTVEVLQRTKPGGATNMTAAFQEAFRYRAAGLDTIYVLSDGLPNVGGGLPPQADRLDERERTARCCKYLRDALKTWNAPHQSLPRVRINAIGFYYDSPDIGAFLWVLAREHDGGFVGMSQP